MSILIIIDLFKVYNDPTKHKIELYIQTIKQVKKALETFKVQQPIKHNLQPPIKYKIEIESNLKVHELKF